MAPLDTISVVITTYNRSEALAAVLGGLAAQDDRANADLVLRLQNCGLVRKNGFFSTEVYHLWHPEASRHDESLNAQRVRERMQSSQIKADRGLGQCRLDGQVIVERWGE